MSKLIVRHCYRPHFCSSLSHRPKPETFRPRIAIADTVRSVGPRRSPVIGQSGQTRRFYSSDFSHPISHRTPHYRVGNGVIGWMVISQKRLNFGMKRNCKIQDKMGCNGLGNRCSDVPYYGATAGPLTNSQTSHPTGRSAAVSDLQKKPGCLKNARHVVQMLYDANLAWHF
jgi:hypothetical protein